jgi:hypothetical protein
LTTGVDNGGGIGGVLENGETADAVGVVAFVVGRGGGILALDERLSRDNAIDAALPGVGVGAGVLLTEVTIGARVTENLDSPRGWDVWAGRLNIAALLATDDPWVEEFSNIARRAAIEFGAGAAAGVGATAGAVVAGVGAGGMTFFSSMTGIGSIFCSIFSIFGSIFGSSICGSILSTIGSCFGSTFCSTGSGFSSTGT